MKYFNYLPLTILVFSPVLRAQVFDFSDGNAGSVLLPCPNGAIGKWTEEEARLYPNGPQEGLVLTSDPKSASCLATPDALTISQNSKFHTLMRVPYKLSYDQMTVWLVEKDRPSYRYEWFKISGPIKVGEEWIEISRDVPSLSSSTEDFTIEIWDSSSTVSVSIRYFIISEEDLIKTTESDPETTITETTETSTTDVITDTTYTSTTDDADTTYTSTTDDVDTTYTSTTDDADTTYTSTTDDVDTTYTSTTDDADTTYTSTTDGGDSTSGLVSDVDESTAPTVEQSSDDQSSQPAGGFVLSAWGVVIGVVIGVLLMSAIFCAGMCFWWLGCVKRRRKEQALDPEVSLPRLAYTTSASHSGSNFSIVGRDVYWPSSSWSHKM